VSRDTARTALPGGFSGSAGRAHFTVAERSRAGPQLTSGADRTRFSRAWHYRARRHEPAPELRVSDADREATVVRLREAGGEGRLTLEELAERVERADSARTRADLDALTADLPATSSPRTHVSAPVTKERRWVVAIMGGEERKGRWRPARRTNAVSIMGGVDIDLREAELADGAEILATAVMGAVTVTVPPGVSVELSGFALMGGNSGPDDKSLPLPDAPVVHVRAYSLMGGVVVERKKPRQP
jgi:Domain of unknown function (DUF1707)/Cell wall-active antibiotics response 4TMS YvqF